MAFASLKSSLAIPTGATAVYTFWGVSLGGRDPVTVTARHAGDGTPAYQAASFRAANANRDRSQDRTLSLRKLRAMCVEDAKLIADHCVVAWTDVYDDGATEPAPCTPEKVLEFLTEMIESDGGTEMFLSFASWIRTAANFRPAIVEGGLGKP